MSSIVPYGDSRRLPVAVGRELDHVKHQAIAQAARVRGIEFVAQEAMFAVGALSDLEARLIEMVPLAEPRLKAIGDIATAAMTAEVASVAGRYR